MKIPERKYRKKFNGKEYVAQHQTKKKTSAQNRAEGYRERGASARVVKGRVKESGSKGKWIVYARRR